MWEVREEDTENLRGRTEGGREDEEALGEEEKNETMIELLLILQKP